MSPVDLNDTAKGRVKGMVELRQIVNDLIEYSWKTIHRKLSRPNSRN